VSFYSRIVDSVVVAAGVKEAEAAKLLENTFRLVNISFVNEMLIACRAMGIDVWEVLRCASTKPFGFVCFEPGAGVGGACIPVNAAYLSDTARNHGYTTKVVDAAREVNREMSHYVTERTSQLLSELGCDIAGARILLIGVSYKADVSDTRWSPAEVIAEELSQSSASVYYYDPFVRDWAPSGSLVRRVSFDRKQSFDVGVWLQHHSEMDVARVTASCRMLLDTRGTLQSIGSDHCTVRRL